MAGDDKKAKADAPPASAPPASAAPASAAPASAAPASAAHAKSKDPAPAGLPKAEGGETAADLSSGYSRGEGQKPVSKAYGDNWNVIFGKKKKR
jgi:hypothetical protein